MNECCEWFINDIKPEQNDYEKISKRKTKFKWKELRQCNSCESKFKVHFIAEFDIDMNSWEVWVYAYNSA